MKIRVAELRRASAVLFDYLEQTGCDEIELDQDHYWSIPIEELYSMYSAPVNLTVGQLSEDLENVRAVVEGRRAYVNYALVWLSTILRFVGSRGLCGSKPPG